MSGNDNSMIHALTSSTLSAVAQGNVERRSIIETMAHNYGMSRDKFERTLRATVVPPDTPPEEFAAFLVVCSNYGLNPFLREIYAMKTKEGKIQSVVSVDGWASLVNRQPTADGMEFEEVFADNQLVGTTCRMYRKDRRVPVVVTEYLRECIQFSPKTGKPKDVWAKWPIRMMRHKAMIQAARYAFGFSGIVDPDEMDRFAKEPHAPEHLARGMDLPVSAPTRHEQMDRAIEEGEIVDGDGVITSASALRRKVQESYVGRKIARCKTLEQLLEAVPRKQLEEACGAYPEKQAQELIRFYEEHLASLTPNAAPEPPESPEEAFDVKSMLSEAETHYATAQTMEDVVDIRALYEQDMDHLSLSQREMVASWDDRACQRIREAETRKKIAAEEADIESHFIIPPEYAGPGEYRVHVEMLIDLADTKELGERLKQFWNDTKTHRAALGLKASEINAMRGRVSKRLMDLGVAVSAPPSNQEG